MKTRINFITLFCNVEDGDNINECVINAFNSTKNYHLRQTEGSLELLNTKKKMILF